LPVEKVWIARWCYSNDDSAFEALSRPHAPLLAPKADVLRRTNG